MSPGRWLEGGRFAGDITSPLAHFRYALIACSLQVTNSLEILPSAKVLRPFGSIAIARLVAALSLSMFLGPYGISTMTFTSLISSLATVFSPWSRTHSLQQAAGEVVSECHGRLSQAVCRSTITMTPDETRGYVRAHAVQYVSSQVDEVLRRHRLSRCHRSQLMVTAVNRLVTMVSHERLTRAPAPQSRPLAA